MMSVHREAVLAVRHSTATMATYVPMTPATRQRDVKPPTTPTIVTTAMPAPPATNVAAAPVWVGRRPIVMTTTPVPTTFACRHPAVDIATIPWHAATEMPVLSMTNVVRDPVSAAAA